MYNIACICQFRDAEDYLSLFHNHHIKLFDKIIYIDHLSRKDFSHLKLKNSSFYRCNITNFTKDLFVYRVFLQDVALKGFDFLFVLDVDEFLPFWSKGNFDEFLRNYTNAGVGTLYWRNGFPKDFKSHLSLSNVKFMKSNASTKKLFYNLNKVSNLIPNEGNHNAKYPFLNQTLFQVRPKRIKSPAHLYHIPFISSQQIFNKFNIFPSLDFNDKIKYFSEGMDANKLYSYVANYRENEERAYSQYDFEDVNLFRFSDTEFYNVQNKILSLSLNDDCAVSISAEVVEKFRSKGFSKSKLCTSILRIDSNRITA